MAGDKGENFLTIYSNDGSIILVNNVDCGDDIVTLQVTAESIISDQKGIVYTYSGDNIFKGVAIYANATEATYPVGTNFTFGKDTPSGDIYQYLTLYIVEGEKPKTTKTFDLSTLNLSAGTHEITVKARASSYTDSPASNAVSYVVAGDTVQVSGTWKFNYSLALPTSLMVNKVSFMNNDDSYQTIHVSSSVIHFGGKNGAGGMDGRETVYSYGKWTNEAYRIITFDGKQTVPKEFYDWFTANAVLQTITFTVDGTSHTALSGMTWGEFATSEYDTIGITAIGEVIVLANSVPHGNADYIALNGNRVIASDVIQPLAYEIKDGGSN